MTDEYLSKNLYAVSRKYRFSELFIIQKEIIMSTNKALVPEAKEALDKFKMEAATEVGVATTY